MGPNTQFKGGRLFGTFIISEAKWVIERLEEENILFRVVGGNPKLGPIAANYGGGFGANAYVEIYVSNGDSKKAETVYASYMAKYCRV